jgi:dTDP-4-amino-4,6-dideoxygalactose transaminase
MPITSTCIRFADLGALHESMRAELDEAFGRVLASSEFNGGSEVERFEAAFAAFHGVPHAAACGSGTDALALALRASGVSRGDEVIVPAMTFVATAEAVLHAGAVPVLADVDPETLLLTEASVSEVRTRYTRAVLPVHLYGHTVGFDAVRAWQRSGLVVIEDAAQAHLASWRGEPVASASDAACFSFYPGKNLGALGDGGIVVSRDEGLLERVRRLRDHGQDARYHHAEVGWNSRLDGLQAAFLSAKLEHLPAWTATRAGLADRYWERLGERLVPWEVGAAHHLLVMRTSADARDELRARLAAAGVETGLHYPFALSEQPALARWSRACPNAEHAAREVLSLPMHPLLDPADVDAVCDVVLEAEDELGVGPCFQVAEDGDVACARAGMRRTRW